MARKLKAFVHVVDAKQAPHVFGPGDEVPKWAEKQITNPKAWADDDTDSASSRSSRPASTPDGSLPPKSGNGSGVDAWLAYARNDENAATLAAAEVVIPDDAKREDIIAALEKAGIATERPAS